jgi:hypothetical protein
MFRVGQAVAAVDDDATTFSHRDARYEPSRAAGEPALA